MRLLSLYLRKVLCKNRKYPLYESKRQAYFEFRQNLNSNDLDKEFIFINSLTNKLNSKLSSNAVISPNLFISTLKHIEKYKICSSETALVLIKSCNLNLVNKFPNQRQYYLNYMFNELFPQLKVYYDQTHYEFYMLNTHVNKAAFDPFDLELRMIQTNIKPNETINYLTIKQLCELSRIELALAQFKSLLETNLNPIAFDLAKTNDKEQSELQLYKTVLKELKLKDKNNLNLISKYVVDYLSIFMNYYNKKQEMDKSLEMFTLLNDELKLKANSAIYSNLIESFLQLNKIDKAEQCFMQYKDAMHFADLLTMFTNIKYKYKVGNEFQNACLESMRLQAGNNQSRFLFIDKLNELSKKHHFDNFLNLMQKLFYSDESANEKQDQTVTDPIENRIDVSEYFCNSLVNNPNRKNKILIDFGKRIAKQLNEADKFKHVKLMVYYAALGDDYALSIDLIDFLFRQRVKLNLNYFLPLIKNAAVKAEQILNEKSEIRVEDTIEYSRMCSLSKMAFGKYNCDFTHKELKILFLTLYTFNSSESMQKRKLSLANIANCLKQTAGHDSFVINFLIYQLCYERRLKVESMKDFKNFGLHLKIVYADFEEIADLIENLNLKSIDRKTLDNLKSYLIYVFRTDLLSHSEFINLEENVILKTVKLLNEICVKNPNLNNSSALKEINEIVYTNVMKILNDHKNIQSQFDNYYKKQIDLVRKIDENPLKKEINTHNNAEELEMNIEKLKNNKENFYPTLRLLIIHLCNSNVKRFNENKKMNNLLGQLPESELTPMICQDLMHFYTNSVNDLDKAKHFCEKMLQLTSQGSDKLFYIDCRKLLGLIKFAYMRNGNVNELIALLNKVSNYSKSNESHQFKEELVRFLYDHVYLSVNAFTLHKLVETMFSSNFINRNQELVSIVLTKYILKNQLDCAYEYFKYNLSNFQLSTLEVIMLSVLLSKKIYNKQVEEIVSYYEPDLAHNMLLFAHLLNENYEKAYSIFSSKGTVNLKVLERCASQIQSNEVLRRTNYVERVSNVLKFKPFANNAVMKSEINSIIKGIFKRF